MNDSEFLNWIYERLVHVHGETPNRDYMHRLRRIIDGKADAQSKPLDRPHHCPQLGCNFSELPHG